jgi:hypothetical protein
MPDLWRSLVSIKTCVILWGQYFIFVNFHIIFYFSSLVLIMDFVHDNNGFPMSLVATTPWWIEPAQPAVQPVPVITQTRTGMMCYTLALERYDADMK